MAPMMWLALFAAAALPVLGFAYQDGIMNCNDGNRYISGIAQPSPFHRRWCGWPKLPLQVVNYACLVGLGLSMGDWKRALLLMTLPSVWFAATHPTVVDAPAMLLAWTAGALFPTHPFVAVLLSCLSGFLHERGPVFGAIYAWHPVMLIGLVCSGWWRKPTKPDNDPLVGASLWGQIKAHRPYQDLANPMTVVWSLRALPFVALMYGCSTRAWVALALAFCSRVTGTDTARYLFWAAPALIADSGDFPLWVLAIHLASFRRAI